MSFEAATARFEQWLADARVETSAKIAVADLRSAHQGRGVVAREDIAADEVLFTIPRLAVLDIHTSAVGRVQPENVAVLEELGQWEALVVVVLYELLLGDRSQWAPYLAVLPTAFDSLMHWTDAELAALSPSLVVLRVGKREAEMMHERLFPAVVGRLGIASQLEPYSDLALFHRAASAIMLYSFDCEEPAAASEDDDEEEDETPTHKSMVPLADTLNADTTLVNANLVYEEEALVMRSTKPIAKDSQVYNTYGELPNAEILRKYGYVEPAGSQHDFAEIPFDTVTLQFAAACSAPAEFVTAVVDALDAPQVEEIDLDLVTETVDCYADGTVAPETTVLVQTLATLAEMIKADASVVGDDATRLTNRVLKKCYQLVELGKTTPAAQALWQAILEQRLLQYPATVPPVDHTRAGMAACVVAGEKKCLEACRQPFHGTHVDDAKMVRACVGKREGKGSGATAKRSRK